ncbi:hypothetical protein PENSPDRAFT_680815 [Peniophora sp. CONT]|nr:hypothetical protein PENSPDRAFT_680815 [Peniophora sp. CONT]
MLSALLALSTASLVSAASQGPTWCGKVYLKNETDIVPPGGQFATPASSSTPLLALRCSPAVQPFLPDDAGASTSAIIVDALVRYEEYADASTLSLPSDPGSATLNVKASVDGTEVASGALGLNGTVLLPFNLSSLSPRIEPYQLSCSATLSSQTFTSASTNLTYLPTPDSTKYGSVTKRDLRTGGLLAKTSNSFGDYETVLPIAFYSNWGDYLEQNDSSVKLIDSLGFNTIHPIPPFDNVTAFQELAEDMEDKGLWLMYDMRWSYTNLTAVDAETAPLRSLQNLLLYYTADEPDGTSDALDAPLKTYNHLQSLDPYRPNSLVLNCQDYHFADYAAGADIIMQDAYPVGGNVTWSIEYETVCTPEQGCCGCDNCKGEFEDIRDRIEGHKSKMEVLGWERSKTIWSVPQAFGGTELWYRAPTGDEFLVQSIVAINAGARGIVSWNWPTPAAVNSSSTSIADTASALAKAMPNMAKDYILHPNVTYSHTVSSTRIDVGLWTRSDIGSALVLASNLNYANASIALSDVFGNVTTSQASMVLAGGASTDGSSLSFGAVKSGAWTFSVPVVNQTSGTVAGGAESSSAASVMPWLSRLTQWRARSDL